MPCATGGLILCEVEHQNPYMYEHDGPTLGGEGGISYGSARDWESNLLS